MYLLPQDVFSVALTIMSQATRYQTIERSSNSYHHTSESGNANAQNSSDSTTPLLGASNPKWESQGELETPRHRLISSIVVGGLSVAFGLAFAALAIVPLALRDQTSDPATCNALIEACKIATTAWPVIFGLVVGGACCSAALYLASDRPSRLGVCSL